MLNRANAMTMASGNEPMPPLVAAMLKLAKINPIKIAANGILSNSGKANVVT